MLRKECLLNPLKKQGWEKITIGLTRTSPQDIYGFYDIGYGRNGDISNQSPIPGTVITELGTYYWEDFYDQDDNRYSAGSATVISLISPSIISYSPIYVYVKNKLYTFTYDTVNRYFDKMYHVKNEIFSS